MSRAVLQSNPWIKFMSRVILIFFFIEQIYFLNCTAETNNESKKNLKQEVANKNAIIIPDNYTRTIPPNYFKRKKKNETMKVMVSVTPHMILSLSEISMDFTVDLTLGCWWQEARIEVSTHRGELRHTSILVPTDIAIQLWHPTFEFTNCKRCDQRLIDPNKHQWQIYTFTPGDPLVLISYRQIFSFTCFFDLKFYPFDEQNCEIFLKIYTVYNSIEPRFFYQEIHELNQTKNFPVPAEFKLVRSYVKSENCDGEHSKAKCERIVFIFQRIATQHLILTFIPSGLIVILSWISFWLDTEAAAPRTALGVTSLLTLATQLNYAQRDLPAVGTIKALDYWMFACIFMVFGSLLEFAIAYNFNRITVLNPFNNQPTGTTITPKTFPWVVVSHSKHFYQRLRAGLQKNPRIIDSISKILFPITYLIFNLCFWCRYYIFVPR